LLKPKYPDYIDVEVLQQIFSLNLKNIILLFIISYLLFIFLPRRLFPQDYAGAGLENVISNILYMLVYLELIVPLMVILKIFSLPSFLAMLVLTKLFFVKYYYHQSPKEYLFNIGNKIIIFLYDLLDEPYLKFKALKKRISLTLFSYFQHLNYFYFLKRVFLITIFIYLIYLLGYRCFISLANPLPQTSYFFEWVADLNLNILYADDKAITGELFYGLAIFIFILQLFTNIDPIILFNIYPLIVITFLLLGVYFVIKRFSLSVLVAMATLLIFGSVVISSFIGENVATWITTTSNPEIISLWEEFKLYQIPSFYFQNPTTYLEKISMNPYIRFFSGTAYELSATLFLINLFYLIKFLDKGYNRYLYNYTFSLLLIFIFHPEGSIPLIVPTFLIFLNALVSFKVKKFPQFLKAILLTTFIGNLWFLAVFKYKVLPDFLDIPFLKTLLNIETDKIELGLEEVTISHLTYHHLFLLTSAISFFVIARFLKKGFYFSSFLLIPLGFFLLFFAQNLGFYKLLHPSKGVTHLYLSVTIIISCYIKAVWLFLKKVFKKVGEIIFLLAIVGVYIISIFFIPHYKETDFFKRFINGVQYSDIPLKLYSIVKENRPMNWTVVSYVQEYSKVKGRGFMINSSNFLLNYSPKEKELPIPTKKIYIFVEDIPHRYLGREEWFYRWRRDIQDRLKEWIGVYSSTHNNIKLYSKTKLLSVYEIDNSEYIERLKRESDVK